MKALTFFYILVLAVLSIGTSLGIPQILHLFEIPHLDKFAHFTLIGILTLLVNRTLNFRTIAIKKTELYLGAIILFPLVTLDEFSHLILKYRGFSWFDLGCNYLGMLVLGGVFKGWVVANLARPPARHLITTAKKITKAVLLKKWSEKFEKHMRCGENHL